MNLRNNYNIHCLLYDITHGHFKSKRLCKHNKHNYQLHLRIEIVPEIEEILDPTLRYKKYKSVKYNKIHTSYWKCYCCGKEIENE